MSGLKIVGLKFLTTFQTIEKPIALPELENSITTKYSLNDKFNEKALKSHWKFFKGFSEGRVKMNGKGLELKGKGTSAADCSPMLCIPSDHSSAAQVKLEIKGDVVGGIEVSAYHHNVLSGFMSLRIGFCSMEKGSVTFKNFEYNPIQ